MKRILALETSDLYGSIAALEDSILLQETILSHHQRSAQSLTPALVTLLQQVGWKPQDVDLIAVTVGPGSFTGLRVGVTAAKTFAYTVGAEILGIDTLETIAANISQEKNLLDEPSPLVVALDAQRGDIVAREFHREGAWYLPTGPQKLLPMEEWLASLVGGTRIASPMAKKITPRLPRGVVLLGEAYQRPRAANVGCLAARDYAVGRRDDLWHLLPHYFRQSAAEEKYAARK